MYEDRSRFVSDAPPVMDTNITRTGTAAVMVNGYTFDYNKSGKTRKNNNNVEMLRKKDVNDYVLQVT